MTTSRATTAFTMLDEADTHNATWVSYVARRSIWGAKCTTVSTGVQKNLETIAKTIAKYEPVNVLVNPGADYRQASQIFAGKENITLYPQPLNDIWIRDYGSVFLLHDVGDIAVNSEKSMQNLCRSLVTADALHITPTVQPWLQQPALS